MNTPKRCVQCGILKQPFEFRVYTHSRKQKGKAQSRYRICKECEALNMRYRRAMERGDAEEFERINDMYKALEALGYRTPLSSKSGAAATNDTSDMVERIMQHHGVSVESVVRKEPVDTTPDVTTMTIHTPDGEETIKVAREPVTKRPEAFEIPEELQSWLDVDMNEWFDADLDPEYLQETIYESLKAKYRPQTGVDRDTYLPIYDDTYKDILNDILRRFDQYEEDRAEIDEGDNDDE